MNKECNCKKKKTICTILKILLFLTIIGAIAYGVYYFFFADDYDELDEDFFKDEDAEAAEDVPAEPASEEQPAKDNGEDSLI